MLVLSAFKLWFIPFEMKGWDGSDVAESEIREWDIRNSILVNKIVEYWKFYSLKQLYLIFSYWLVLCIKKIHTYASSNNLLSYSAGKL